MNYESDGSMATASNYQGLANYWPNSRENTPLTGAKFNDPAWSLGETIVDRFD